MKESINSSNDSIQSLQIIDNHLQRIGKCIISIKRDGRYLPRALFSGLGRKHALKDLNTYKELIRLCIRELVNDNENLYTPWLSDSIESIQIQLEQYEKIKKITPTLWTYLLRLWQTLIRRLYSFTIHAGKM